MARRSMDGRAAGAALRNAREDSVWVMTHFYFRTSLRRVGLWGRTGGGVGGTPVFTRPGDRATDGPGRGDPSPGTKTLGLGMCNMYMYMLYYSSTTLLDYLLQLNTMVVL